MKITPALLKQLWLTFSVSLAFLIIGLVRGYSASGLPSIQDNDPDLITNNEHKSWIGQPFGSIMGAFMFSVAQSSSYGGKVCGRTLLLVFRFLNPLVASYETMGRDGVVLFGGHATGSIPPLGAFLGSVLSGPLMQRAGRRWTLMLTAPLWMAAWLILGFARIFPMVLLGRMMSGLCVGFVLAPVQVYVSECCDPEIRGRLGSLPTLSMSLGILLSYVAGNWLYWRYLAFFSAFFCAALFVALLPLPESPVWQESQGIDASAAKAWLHLSARATAVVQDDDDKQEKKGAPPSLFTRKVFFSSPVIKPMVVGFTLLFFQQFSGIDSVIFFTVEIFKKAGSRLDAMTATIIIGVVQLLSNVVSTVLVDHAGRRPLLLTSATVMCASMVSMGAAFYLEYDNNSFFGYLPIGSLVVFILGYSLGFGGLPFLLLGELFPTHYRSQLSAMASAVNLLSMFTVIKSYHALDIVLTSAGTFWMYACFCALAVVFVLFAVPETKGKSLGEIEQHFRGKKKREKEQKDMHNMGKNIS